jgi:hypothetical protein
VRFTRRVLREATGWGDTQLKLHLSRLVELEHVLVHRAERGQGFVYELLYDGDGTAAPHLSGLIDPQALAAGGYDARRSGLAAERSALEGKRAAAGRPVAGVWAAPGQQEEAAKEEGLVSTFTESAGAAPKPLFPPAAKLNGSHPPHPIVANSSLAASL